MSTRTLLLTSWGVPHAILNWYQAICLVYLGKVDVLEQYEDTVSSPSVTYHIPAVLRLRGSSGKARKGVKFSRVNVYARDHYTCQYCGMQGSASELNYDHVVPRQYGGKTTWNNIVTSCYDCNRRKGARTPEQAGMPLARRPTAPKTLPPHGLLVAHSEDIPELWIPYLPLDNRKPSGNLP